MATQTITRTKTARRASEYAVEMRRLAMNCAAVEESSSDLTGEDHKDPETRSAAESQEYPTALEFRLIVLLTLSALVALGEAWSAVVSLDQPTDWRWHSCDDNIFLFSDPKPSDTSITFRKKLVELDPLSHQLVSPALTGLFIAFSWAGTKYPWDDGKVIRPLVTFAILIVAFLYNQRRRGDAAALSPRILKSRNVITSAIFTIFVREYSPSKSDYMIVPIVIGATIRMLLCGSGTSITGYYTPFMLFSSTLIPTFAGLITTFGVNTSFIRLLLYPGAFGFASGIGFNAPISAVQTVLPKVDVPLGPVNCGLAQHFGPAVFVAIAQDIFTSGLLTNLARVVPGLDPATIESDGLPEIVGCACTAGSTCGDSW
ncbi:hypothetical protein ETB97_003524 [Aspergillus alliaceus]|uniref:Uncharacterized protein n=1 Tax=Petromyces alliaceus TaxID=209559 RepID=A0A8H6A1M7_PETAA|nr:hypothetical protein ETB97_003524 [Aspergillus burnettii]